MLLSSGTSSVLLNGVPGKLFHCKQGVRQGDPISSLLFVLAADLLQSMLNEAMHNSIISSPLRHTSSTDFPVIQYADDTILLAQADIRQAQQIKHLLNFYAEYNWLKINYSKSSLLSINTPPEKMQQLSTLLGCNIGTLPHKYLVLPLCTAKPRIEDFVPMLKRIENRLLGCSTLLSTGDKLTLIKSVFTSMPTFFMCTLTIPKTVLKQVNT